jgi:phosphoglycolate phosphatase
VFDLDGTLVDSRRDLAESANAVLQDFGCPPLSEVAVGAMVGEGAATLVARVFEASGRPAPDNALAAFLSVYSTRLLNHTRPYQGIPELLEALAGKSTLAVLTNKPLASAAAILGAFDLSTFFVGGIIGGDGPLPRKPDPAGLLHLMHAAGAPAGKTLLVGDSMTDRHTASAGGVRYCLAGYGFGAKGSPPRESASGDFRLEHPLDLLRLL